MRGGRIVQTFWDELTNVQLTVLDLLGLPPAAYGH
jgi:hypothetical protein